MTTDEGVREPALAAEGLSVRYGQRRLLDDVTFAVPPGSVFALLGRNTSGHDRAPALGLLPSPLHALGCGRGGGTPLPLRRAEGHALRPPVARRAGGLDPRGSCFCATAARRS